MRDRLEEKRKREERESVRRGEREERKGQVRGRTDEVEREREREEKDMCVKKRERGGKR